MSSRSEAHDAFNRSIKLFLREMNDKHPGRFRQLRVVRLAYKALKGMNRRWPRKVFQDTVGAHAAHVRAADEAFFLRPEFSIPLFEDFIASVKADWGALDNDAKRFVWGHLWNMLDCSERCARVEAGADPLPARPPPVPAAALV